MNNKKRKLLEEILFNLCSLTLWSNTHNLCNWHSLQNTKQLKERETKLNQTTDYKVLNYSYFL